MGRNEIEVIPFDSIIKRYEKEICKNCISEKCEKGIIVSNSKEEGTMAKCVDYKYNNENPNKKTPESWQTW